MTTSTKLKNSTLLKLTWEHCKIGSSQHKEALIDFKYALNLVYIFSVVFLASCTSNYQKAAIRPVVRVNDRILTVKQFSDELARKMSSQDAIAAKDSKNLKRTKDEIVNEFIQTSLMYDWAKVNSLKINDSDLESAVKEIRASYPDDLSFRRFLAEENLSYADWKESVKRSLLIQAVFKKIREHLVPPSEEEIKRYYQDKIGRFKQKEKIFLTQIVLPDEAAAEQVEKTLKGKDFGELAKKYSIAPEGKIGGVVGWVEKGTIDFFDQLFSLPLGAVTKIVKSPFGFHILRIDKKSASSVKTLDEVRSLIIKELLAKREQAEFVKWLDSQLRSNKILKDNDLINSINISTKGSNE